MVAFIFIKIVENKLKENSIRLIVKNQINYVDYALNM